LNDEPIYRLKRYGTAIHSTLLVVPMLLLWAATKVAWTALAEQRVATLPTTTAYLMCRARSRLATTRWDDKRVRA
jgi:hypothetical protein